MPKMIGKDLPGAQRCNLDNATPEQLHPGFVQLTYKQAAKLPPECVLKSLDTTDKGSRGGYAKRWWRWFAQASVILECEEATAHMARKARAAQKRTP
jgi:hypothetical protein